ncbi:hypothetical protein BDV18DRAFT_144844 [Aspergillus unguis]
MQKAIEQAGSEFTGWISSCLSCLESNGDDERIRHQQAMKNKGAEREMQLCHSQPHLVPPMKLVVYDDLPSPGPPRTSSFPSWVMEEGRNLASRASSRASMSFRRKSNPPVTISAPTDFRRVTTLPTISSVETGYQPLELSFQSPANPLPDLPRFSDFDFNKEQAQEAPAPIARPARALSTMTDFAYQSRPRTHRPTSSFNLPRKPVGSGSRRSSLATLELLMERQVPISHPLIPHFSIRSSTASVATGLATTSYSIPHTWLDSGMGNLPQPKGFSPWESYGTPESITRQPPKATPQAQSKSLPPIPISTPLSKTQSYEPALPSTPKTPDNRPFNPPASSMSRSGRVTQWLLQQTSSPRPSTSTSATATTSRPSSSRKPSFSFSLGDKMSMRIRSRTLSGSTLAPSISNIDTVSGGFKATATPILPNTTARMPTLNSSFEKDLEIPYLSSSPFMSASRQVHQTIPEAQRHSSRDTLGYDTYSHPYSSYPHGHHRHSAIGVAY